MRKTARRTVPAQVRPGPTRRGVAVAIEEVKQSIRLSMISRKSETGVRAKSDERTGSEKGGILQDFAITQRADEIE